jgi:hypothetical protein
MGALVRAIASELTLELGGGVVPASRRDPWSPSMALGGSPARQRRASTGIL